MKRARSILLLVPFVVAAADFDVRALAAKLQSDGAESFTTSWNDVVDCVAGKCAVVGA